VGGLGLAASANLHPGRAGCSNGARLGAPLAGKGIANPMAAVLTGALMFEQLGHPEAALDSSRPYVRRSLLACGRPISGGTAGNPGRRGGIAARL